MSAATQKVPGARKRPPTPDPTVSSSLIFRIVALALIDAITIWLVYQMVWRRLLAVWRLSSALVTIWVNIVFLSGRFYPLRYIAPGLSLMVIMVLVPHPLHRLRFVHQLRHRATWSPSRLAIEQIESQIYLPADATIYTWTAYKNPARASTCCGWSNPNDPANIFTVTPGAEPVAREGEPPAEHRRLHAGAHEPAFCRAGRALRPHLWRPARPCLQGQPDQPGPGGAV